MVMSLLDMVLAAESPIIETARQMRDAALRGLEAAAGDNRRIPEHQVALIRQALDEAAKHGASADAVSLAFMAGVQFSNCSMMLRLRGTIRQGTLMPPGKKSADPDWSEIIGAAVERHNSTPRELLEILGGRRGYEKESGIKMLEFCFDGETDWDSCVHEQLPPIEWERFVRLVNKARDRKVGKKLPFR